MTIRELIEERERRTLSKYATLSCDSKGRSQPEDPDEVRTCFQVDRDRIIYSKAFKRLKGKTQVFIMPTNDHFENRLTHTLEAAQVARTIAVALNLNETLAEAIMLAHDVNHSAFGHAGEEALNELFYKGFDHQDSAIRRLERLEKRGSKRGLNLTFEVLDGVIHHSGFTNKPQAQTKEGTIAPFADKIAYLVNDMENAIKAGIISDIPASIKSVLGSTKSQMMDTMIKNIIYASQDTPYVHMSDKIFEIVYEFREFMYKNVYFSPICRRQVDKAIKIIRDLYNYLKNTSRRNPRGL
jgi:HD domain.